jgi:hypothetical protein
VAVETFARRNPAGRADATARPVRHGETVQVRRGAILRHCQDVEDGVDQGVALSYVRYEAGEDCVVATLPDQRGVSYTYTDDVAAFQDEARQAFLSWLGALAYGAHRRARSVAPGVAFDVAPGAAEGVAATAAAATVRSAALATQAARPSAASTASPSPSSSSGGVAAAASSGGFRAGGS